MSKHRPTKAEQAHMDAVAALGCLICGRPAQLHHPRPGIGLALRASHWDVLPLCPVHHNEQHPDSLSIHRNPIEFRETYGTEAELLQCVAELLKRTA